MTHRARVLVLLGASVLALASSAAAEPAKTSTSAQIPIQTAQATPPPAKSDRPRIPDRIPVEVAQRAVLLEQDPNDPQGKHFDGTVTWRTETVSPGPGLAPELEVHGDITIPERHMTVTLSLRRNTDKALPASHTIQIMFNLPPDFPAEGVSSMPGIFAKNSEQATGTPLAGISVKVADNYFRRLNFASNL